MLPGVAAGVETGPQLLPGLLVLTELLLHSFADASAPAPLLAFVDLPLPTSCCHWAQQTMHVNNSSC